jgi:hypothetical protein
MKQRINKFIYGHKRLNALFWWIAKWAVFEIRVIEDAKITSASMVANGHIEYQFMAKKTRKEYIWRKDNRNVQE